MSAATGTVAQASAAMAIAAPRKDRGSAAAREQARLTRPSTTGVAGDPCHATAADSAARAEAGGPAHVRPAHVSGSSRADNAAGDTNSPATPRTAAAPAAAGRLTVPSRAAVFPPRP